ncbi:MAG: hypothetical protein ACYDHM_05175 [Acidiferrobacterales bacterium]
MSGRYGLAVALVGAAMAGISVAAQAVGSATVGVAPAYYEGNYGTSSTTQIYYLPFYVKYRQNNLTLKATVPLLSVHSTGAVLSGGTVVGSRGATTSTTESGLGDIWLEGRYRIRGTGTAPDILPYAKIKLGTASRSSGLGTGENDYEGGVGFEWSVGTTVFPFADVGYRIVGSAPGLALQNIATYDGGASAELNSQNFLTGMFTGHQSEQPGFPDAADAIVAWNYSPQPGHGLQVYFDEGLSNGSPNWGVGVGLERPF